MAWVTQWGKSVDVAASGCHFLFMTFASYQAWSEAIGHRGAGTRRRGGDCRRHDPGSKSPSPNRSTTLAVVVIRRRKVGGAAWAIRGKELRHSEKLDLRIDSLGACFYDGETVESIRRREQHHRPRHSGIDVAFTSNPVAPTDDQIELQ